VDVRLVAATNTDLKRLIEEDLFREDLYYRLNVVSLNLPPLRNRKEDIPLLMSHFLNKFNEKFNISVSGFSPGIVQIMKNYDWPGNVRELENVIERALATCKSNEIGIEDLPLDLFVGNEKLVDFVQEKDFDLFSSVEKFEQQIILTVLEKTKWNQAKASEILCIHRNTLLKKIKKFGLREKPE
jgi:DNA-binding NtrC family response regulator